jgi:aryl-alcohol dehydrogenase-like predicted oxidoreductase
MRENVGLLAYSPLAFGYLSGKYRNNEMPKDSRMGLYADIWGRYRKEKAYEAVDEYYKLSKKKKYVVNSYGPRLCQLKTFCN